MPTKKPSSLKKHSASKIKKKTIEKNLDKSKTLGSDSATKNNWKWKSKWIQPINVITMLILVWILSYFAITNFQSNSKLAGDEKINTKLQIISNKNIEDKIAKEKQIAELKAATEALQKANEEINLLKSRSETERINQKSNEIKTKQETVSNTNTNTDIVLDNPNLVKIASNEHVKWDINSRFTLIDYSDFECPFCKRFHYSAKWFLNDNIWKVNMVYRHFPLWFHGPIALKESEATECAWEIGWNESFWKFVDKIYDTTKSNWWMKIEQLFVIAEQVNLDWAKFKSCLNSGKYTSYIKLQMQQWIKAWVKGTPWSFIIDNKTWKTYPIYWAKSQEYLQSIIDWIK